MDVVVVVADFVDDVVFGTWVLTLAFLCCWGQLLCFAVLWICGLQLIAFLFCGFVGMDPTVPSIWAHSPATPHHT